MKIQRVSVAFAGIALLLLLGVLLRDRPAGAQEVPAVLRAQVIELVDGGGLVRAQLKVEPDGEVVFRLRDKNGTVRVKLGAGVDGSGLLLANEKTEPGVHILATRTRTFVALQRDRKRRVLRP
jgi:hypothetical protein